MTEASQNIRTIKRQYPNLIGALYMFLGAILFSTKAIFVKLAYQYDVDSVSLLTLRMVFALPFYVVIAWWSFSTTPLETPLKIRDFAAIAFLGIGGYYLASLFDFIGLQYISASMERLILFAYPTLVVFLSAIVLKKPIGSIQFIALIITYLGITLTFYEKAFVEQSQQFLWGAFWVFIAALTYAIYIVGSGQWLPRLGTWRFTSLAMIASAFAILCHHGLTRQWQLAHFERPVYYYTIAMATIATVIPSFLISAGIKLIGANNASIIGSVGPVSTIILAYIFLNERLSLLQFLGTLIVILGVLIISTQKNALK